MEIGPITGIRPITRTRPSSTAPDLSGVFAVELRKQSHDEAPAHPGAERGLEDEEAEDAAPGAEDEPAAEAIDVALDPRAGRTSTVSFFA